MSITFPAIKPSSREFKMGTYPTKTYRAMAGTTVKRSFGNYPYGYELSVEFRNIDNATLEQILAHYDYTAGGFVRFTLPVNLFAGTDEAIRARVRAQDRLRWEYAGPPSVQSVLGGISTVSVTFIGEMMT